MSETAHKILSESMGQMVLVRLRGDRDIRGKLRSFDIHLNIVLDDAEELREDKEPRKLGTIVIRGENVILISPT